MTLPDDGWRPACEVGRAASGGTETIMTTRIPAPYSLLLTATMTLGAGPSVSTRTFSGNGHRTDERLPVEDCRQYLVFQSTLMREGAWPCSGLPAD